MKYIFTLLLSIIISQNVFAHSSKEISYIIDKKGNLTIHLTPNAAYDLLKKKQPNLGTSVNFNDYKDYFKNYLNQNIKLKINNVDQKIIVDSMSIGSHDSEIYCRIAPHFKKIESFLLQSNAFFSLYPDGINIFEITVIDDIKICKLTKENNVAIYRLSSKSNSNYLYLIIIPIIILLILIFRKK